MFKPIELLKELIPLPKEGFKIPKTAQDAIPIRRVYPDGIFYSDGQYSQSWKFKDINYSVSSPEAQMDMFMDYCAIINALDSEATTKITINNHRLDKSELERTTYMSMRNDGLDNYRKEYNEIIYQNTAGTHSTAQEKYITVTVARKNIEEARNFFRRIGTELTQGFGRLSSGTALLSLQDRFEIIHNFFRNSAEPLAFDLKSSMSKGHDFKDAICPENIEFKGSYFQVGEQFGCVLFLSDYATYIKDSMITDLCDFDRNLMLSVDILPVQTVEAVKLVQKQILAVETDRARYTNRQNRNGNFTANIPYEMDQALSETKELLDDITTRDQRMMFVYVTIVHLADSLEKLDSDTEQITAIARQKLCQFQTMKFRQEIGLNTVLPYGPLKISKSEMRTLTTESTAVLLPFKAQEIIDRGGVYCGKNSVSQNIIVCDRSRLLNPHSWTLGVSGSGKSMINKSFISYYILNTDDDVVILDVQNEYSPLVNSLGGSRIEISATSKTHINAFDINSHYGGDEETPIAAKSEFILSLCEQIFDGEHLGAKQKSIIDRCTELTLRNYVKNGYKGTPPTLTDFAVILKAQPEAEAHEIALALELFISGSLNIFSHQTNVDISNRVVCYDLSKLGKQLRKVGSLITLDALLNRVTANREAGRRTHIFCDEAHIYFGDEYTANFFSSAFRTFRKFNAYLNAMTQNISECLSSETARIMIANSEFLVLLNQSATDREKLAEMLNLSETQLSHITNSPQGCGLLKVGSDLVPFENIIPNNLELYRLMSTKPGEK